MYFCMYVDILRYVKYAVCMHQEKISELKKSPTSPTSHYVMTKAASNFFNHK